MLTDHISLCSNPLCQIYNHCKSNNLLTPCSSASTRVTVPTFCVDGGDAFGGADIPDADGFISRSCDKQVRVGRVPAELIHAVPMTSVVVFFHLDRQTSTFINPKLCLPRTLPDSGMPVNNQQCGTLRKRDILNICVSLPNVHIRNFCPKPALNWLENQIHKRCSG